MDGSRSPKVLVALVAICGAPLFVGCVGSESVTSGSGSDGGQNDGTTGASETGPVDTGTDMGDTGSADAGSTDASIEAETLPPCADSGPAVFGPKAGEGPFCPAAASGNACNLGDHCCYTPGVANLCASGCPASSIDVACWGQAECSDAGTLICCGVGTLDTTTCSYPQVTLRSSRCESSCATGEFQLCETNLECSVGGCVGARTNTVGATGAVCR
jgi:hypothetical protein